MLARSLSLVALVSFSLLGCGGSVAADRGDASTSGADPDVVTTGHGCCIAPVGPGCCMTFGGWSETCSSPGEVCDGLPDPGDPRWEKRVDAHGCPYLYAPPEIPISCGVPFETGPGIPDVPPDVAPVAPKCCAISERPACCMSFGGSVGKDCPSPDSFELCDNLPSPGDPRWEKRVDENGCPYWYAPPEIPISCGVGGPPDTGVDAMHGG